MGSQKTLYRVKSTGQFVIQSGSIMRATRSGLQVFNTYDLLNQDYEPTGKTVQVSPDDLEEFSR